MKFYVNPERKFIHVQPTHTTGLKAKLAKDKTLFIRLVIRIAHQTIFEAFLPAVFSLERS